ncbi:MAG TPA: alpha/beta fold hydrolase [Rhodanobacteraceae bacterium]|nr:alpha/beta fold hydrolase [Rhodanobacteraceae bacterium]
MLRWIRWALLIVVVAIVCSWIWALIAVRGTFVKFQPDTNAGGEAVAAGAEGHRIVGRVYVDGAPDPVAPLVVVLHGDAPFIHPGYQYAFADDIAKAAPGTRAVGLMRPGYADRYGARSDGDRGFASGENYTADVVHDVAEAIRALQKQWQAPSVVLVGHSGGSAIAANLAATEPGLVRHVFLVSCPCDVPAFRKHMAALQWAPMWLLPAHSLSPIETLDRMDRATIVSVFSGSEDPLTLPSYAKAYVDKATSLSIKADLVTIAGKGHEILDDPAVEQAVVAAARERP